MTFTKTAWVDGGAPAITAAQLNRIEQGVSMAHAGRVFVDDFTGTDAQRMQAAMNYAAAQTRVPWIILPDRIFDTGSASFVGFTGLKVMGPGFPQAPMNEEIASGKGVVGKWKTTCGNGASSLIRLESAVYDVCFSNITFHGGSSSQIFRSTVNAYACSFNNLMFYGCGSAFGRYASSEKFLMTQVDFTGHWAHQGSAGTQYLIGGSDNSLWMGGYINIDVSGTIAANTPTIVFDSMSKTDVGYIYGTSRTDWGGIVINGNQANNLNFFGGSFEGVSAGSPAKYSPFTINGGTNKFYGPWIGQVSSAGTTNGVVTQTGGVAIFYSPVYNRADAAPVSFPWLYQTGGVARIYSPVSMRAGEQMSVRWSSGTTDTVPLITNGITI